MCIKNIVENAILHCYYIQSQGGKNDENVLLEDHSILKMAKGAQFIYS